MYPLRKVCREWGNIFSVLHLLMYLYSSVKVEFHQREDYLDPVYVLWKIEYLKFKNLALHVFYEWFGLRFTGAGLPSLARRARVPADFATLSVLILTNTKSKFICEQPFTE